MIIVIVPVARLENVLAVYAQWEAQTFRGAELCFCPTPELQNFVVGSATVLEGTRTIGAARNAGIEYGRRRRHDWAVFWDDDNYHGPEYLEEVAREAPGWDVLSKGIAFVRHDSGLWKYERPLGFYPGHSTSVRIAAAARFPDLSLAEDVEWSARMKATGARAKHLPPWGLVYDRRFPDGHAYDASEAEFLRAHGPARGPWGLADSAVDAPGSWGLPMTSAKDEAVFASMERRARLRLGGHHA